jgi:hypothetical protein
VSIYEHAPNPHTVKRLSGQAPPPAKVDDQRVGLNGRIGLMITTLVGTMVCAYVFAAIALVSLPSAIRSHSLTILIAWVSSTFLQLILLPVIIVGQNLQAKASDKRAEQTYKDAEAVLREAIEIQKHLRAQDDVLGQLVANVKASSADGSCGSADRGGGWRDGRADGGGQALLRARPDLLRDLGIVVEDHDEVLVIEPVQVAVVERPDGRGTGRLVDERHLTEEIARVQLRERRAVLTDHLDRASIDEVHVAAEAAGANHLVAGQEGNGLEVERDLSQELLVRAREQGHGLQQVALHVQRDLHAQARRQPVEDL